MAVRIFHFTVMVAALRSGMTQHEAPTLPPSFQMDAKCSSWIDDKPTQCRLAYTNNGLGNRLYMSCLFQGVNKTKLFDFTNDVLIIYNGSAVPWRSTKGIPESEKNELCFPAKFRTEGGRKLFDKPDALFHFDGNGKKPAQGLLPGANEWKVKAFISLQGETYECTNYVTFTRESKVSPYCDGTYQTRLDCPPVPHFATVLCGDHRIIRYSFGDYVEEYDHSVFEYSQHQPSLGGSTTEVPNCRPSNHDVPEQGLSPGIVAILCIAMLILGVVMRPILENLWRRVRRERPAEGSHAAEIGAEVTSGTTYRNEDSSSLLQMSHIGTTEGSPTIKFDTQLFISDEKSSDMSVADKGTTASSQAGKSFNRSRQLAPHDEKKLSKRETSIVEDRSRDLNILLSDAKNALNARYTLDSIIQTKAILAESSLVCIQGETDTKEQSSNLCSGPSSLPADPEGRDSSSVNHTVAREDGVNRIPPSEENTNVRTPLLNDYGEGIKGEDDT